MASACDFRCGPADALNNEPALRRSGHSAALAEVAEEGGEVQAVERALGPQVEACIDDRQAQTPFGDPIAERRPTERSIDAARSDHDVGGHVLKTEPPGTGARGRNAHIQVAAARERADVERFAVPRTSGGPRLSERREEVRQIEVLGRKSARRQRTVAAEADRERTLKTIAAEGQANGRP